jgi:Zn-dependent protease with chaperone function
MITDKEAYLVECVKKAAKSLGLKYPPKVKVWEGACPYSSGNEIAHTHPDLGLICLSKGKLESMNLDEIRETAFHETTHMLHIEHDTDFSTSMDDAHLAAWLDEHRPRTIILS